MRTRRGVSLVEVLVAAVLLAVGASAALSALLAAERLRVRAAAREAVARAVEARLTWFQRTACSSADSSSLVASMGVVEETWRVTRAGAVVRLEGRAAMRTLGPSVRLPLVHERRCP